jgi:hypothetical protein
MMLYIYLTTIVSAYIWPSSGQIQNMEANMSKNIKHVMPTWFYLHGITYAVLPTRYYLRGITYTVLPTRYYLHLVLLFSAQRNGL